MRDLYDNLKEPLYFKVSDMLRGKCAFSVIEKINQCCTDIKEALKTKQYSHLKLIEVDNRLRKGTSDLVLKILFGNVCWDAACDRPQRIGLRIRSQTVRTAKVSVLHSADSALHHEWKHIEGDYPKALEVYKEAL